jgi:hypothetical protein
LGPGRPGLVVFCCQNDDWRGPGWTDLAVAAPILPVGPADWLLRVTPAAAFAIQPGTPQYPQVSSAYTPFNGYYPLAPWAGFAVLCAWAALVFGLAVVLLRRRDA